MAGFINMNERKKSKKLSSWKEISAYLGYSERSCRRLEMKVGLPVYRLDKNSNSRVFAYADELDAWLRKGSNNAPTSHSNLLTKIGRRKGLLVFLLIALGSIICGFFLFFSSSSSQPADFAIKGPILIIFDAKGKELWKFDTGLENLVEEKEYKLQYQIKKTTNDNITIWPEIIIKDINHDHDTEVVFSTQTQDEYKEGDLYCFNHKGKQLWHFKAGGPHKFGAHEFSSDYRIEGIAPFDLNKDGKLELFVMGAHMKRFPTQLAVLSSEGHLLGEFWNSGRITDFAAKDIDNDGSPELLAVGTNNEYGKACLIVFNPNLIKGGSPQLQSNFKCDDFPSGTEKYYVLFPRTAVDLAEYSERETMREIIVLDNGRIKVTASSSDLSFELDDNLEIRDVQRSVIFQRRYDKFLREGRIKSPIDDSYLEELNKGALYWNGKEWVSRPTMNSIRNIAGK
jgi:hypothetical protein